MILLWIYRRGSVLPLADDVIGYVWNLRLEKSSVMSV